MGVVLRIFQGFRACRQIILNHRMIDLIWGDHLIVVASPSASSGQVPRSNPDSGFTPSGHEGKGKISHTPAGHEGKGGISQPRRFAARDDEIYDSGQILG